MAERVDIATLPEDEALALVREHYRVSDNRARFILGLVRGDHDGDVVSPDANLADNPFSTVDLHLPGKHNQKRHGSWSSNNVFAPDHVRQKRRLPGKKPGAARGEAGKPATNHKQTGSGGVLAQPAPPDSDLGRFYSTMLGKPAVSLADVGVSDKPLAPTVQQRFTVYGDRQLFWESKTEQGVPGELSPTHAMVGEVAFPGLDELADDPPPDYAWGYYHPATSSEPTRVEAWGIDEEAPPAEIRTRFARLFPEAKELEWNYEQVYDMHSGEFIRLTPLGEPGDPFDFAFDPNQPRDEKGKWSRSGGGLGGARGNSLFDAFLVGEGEELTPARTTLDAISRTHGVGKVPRVPVVSTTNKMLSGGLVHDEAGTPRRIVLNAHDSTPHLTAAHEIGHFVDLAGLPGEGRYASEASEALAPVRDALDASDAVKTLREMKSNPDSYAVPDSEFPSFSHRPKERYLDYLLEPKEMFARGYAQYIAQRSGDPAILEELKRYDGREKLDLVYPESWSEEDFVPIASEFDRLFENQGWRE